MDRSLRRLPIGPTSAVAADRLTVALRAAIDGSGPALAPIPAAPAATAAATAAATTRGRPSRAGVVPAAVALVVRTSGSTGEARDVMLDTDALRASATATADRLDGPGRWVLALPLGHIAGLQVLVRSILAATRPVVVPAVGGFDPAGFARAVAQAHADRPRGQPLYTSLVPTQLHRVLVACGSDGRLPAELAPLRHLDAVLLGGAAVSPDLLDRARGAGLRVVTTYGMTETCGGCVYDGRPLAGVRVAVHADGVRLAGPVLARGYLPDGPQGTGRVDGQGIGLPDGAAGPAHPDDVAFTTDADGVRWFRTRDLGDLDDGVLSILGRSDDVVVTGGHKVAPAAVEAALAGVAGVGQVCVVGVPDAEWGHVLAAVVVPATGAGTSAGPTLERLREAVTRSLGGAAAPRHLLLVTSLPERGPGKVDRAEVSRRAAVALDRDT
ncbi:AMP-binding protein [Cellulomonas sp. KRMCY2]|uniref:AMP-binding protein n=1 Tax=Cellulomonas sp. KRMCY2 TaxID=1304865 RepID=UPI00045E9F0B|nr:AMP-binding protein [Cellulomonas sp. KRMCY2]